MKRLNVDVLMTGIGIVLGITLFTLVIFNIITYGISDTASFEF